MQVIGLFGSANSGKTTTLTQVIEQLKLHGEEIFYEEISSRDKFFCVLYQGQKICIATGGDNDKALEKNCAFFNEYSPDIAISATRTQGNTHKQLEHYATEQGPEVIWIKKLTYHNRGYNDEDSELIYSELNNVDTFRVLKAINSQSVKIIKSIVKMQK